MRKQQWAYRIGFYLAGILILALGLTLNTKCGMGVSPMLSVSYSASELFGLNFGNATFALYLFFVVIQLAIRGRDFSLGDWLQIPFNIVFTRLLNVFNDLFQIKPSALWGNLLVLFAALVLTGIGAATVVNARLVPNPADGMVHTIAERTGKDMGFVKNVADVICVLVAIVLGLAFAGRIVGVGVGTVCAVVFVGRIIWLHNRLFGQKIAVLSGLAQPKLEQCMEETQVEPT